MSEWTEAHDGLLKRAQRAEARIAELEAALRECKRLTAFTDGGYDIYAACNKALESAKDKT